MSNLKYIRRIFESSYWDGDLQRLLDLGLMIHESDYAEMIRKASTYIRPSKTNVDYSTQIIKVETGFDESFGNLCEYHDINVNSYALSRAERDVYTIVEAEYDLQRGVVKYSVSVFQADLQMNESASEIKSLVDRGLDEGVKMSKVAEIAKFIADDIADFATGEAINISVDLLKGFLQKKGYLDFA